MQQDYAEYNHFLSPLRNNEVAAFNELYNISRNRLLVLALYIINNEEAAKDLVQDFFVDFWEKKLYEHIEGSLKVYLIHAIRNRAIKYKKKQDTLNYLKVHFNSAKETDSLHHIENEELKSELEAAIQKLPPMASTVFRLHYQERLSHNEISKTLGISKSTISSHIDRALKELRKELKKNL